MSETTQTVFIVDDDVSFLATMSRWLRAFGYTVKSFTSAADFFAHRSTDAAGCVVADLQMPGMDGMALQATLAQLDNPLPIVFLTGHGDIPTSVRAMRSGAEDFLLKTASKEDLLAAIESALTRDLYEHEIRRRQYHLAQRFAKLTPRETDVLSHVLQGGWLNKQIAAELGIDERSVKRHRHSVMEKLDVKSVVELTQLVDETQSHNVMPILGDAVAL
jgi:FixJ family two-component response regulator